MIIAKKILGEDSRAESNVESEKTVTVEIEKTKPNERGNNIEVTNKEANNVLSFNININLKLDK